MNDYGKLKSGTDIRGRAIASEGKPAVLTEQAVADIASAFALWISRRIGKTRCKIAVGRDSRLTGESFTRTVIAALKYSGLEIFDCGLFSTPAAFLTTQFPSMSADGAIMITARRRCQFLGIERNNRACQRGRKTIDYFGVDYCAPRFYAVVLRRHDRRYTQGHGFVFAA